MKCAGILKSARGSGGVELLRQPPPSYCAPRVFDGSGYPRGLRRGEIPLAARIFRVVDSLDAMLTTGPIAGA